MNGKRMPLWVNGLKREPDPGGPRRPLLRYPRGEAPLDRGVCHARP